MPDGGKYPGRYVYRYGHEGNDRAFQHRSPETGRQGECGTQYDDERPAGRSYRAGACCTAIDDAEGSWYFTFKYDFDPEMAKRGYFTVDKGSVTVNGVSLTVCNPTENTFQVAIIPYTYEHTNFHTLKVGSVVNLEFDIIGKYLSRMMQLTGK